MFNIKIKNLNYVNTILIYLIYINKIFEYIIQILK